MARWLRGSDNVGAHPPFLLLPVMSIKERIKIRLRQRSAYGPRFQRVGHSPLHCRVASDRVYIILPVLDRNSDCPIVNTPVY